MFAVATEFYTVYILVQFLIFGLILQFLYDPSYFIVLTQPV